MKVMLLTTHINIGGVGLYTLNLAKGLIKRGVDCIVASSGGSLLDHFRKEGIPLMHLDIKTKCEFNPKLISPIKRLINFGKKTDLDIVHAHTRVAQVMAELITKFTDAAFVSTCHGFFNRRRISRKAFPCWGDKIIAISQPVKEHLRDDFNIPEKDITVIHNGVDFNKYRRTFTKKEKDALKRKFKIGHGPLLGSIGRLSSVKGYKFLLFALKGIKKDFPGASLILIGEGPEEDALRTDVKKLGLEKSVIFMNSTLDTEKFLQIMDIFIFPSLQEGLGLSLLEAMACGKACIATSIGGIGDIIDDGENGLLVPPSDSYHLEEAIKRLLQDKKLCSSIEQRAPRSIRNEFSLDKMVDETVELYKRVLKKG